MTGGAMTVVWSDPPPGMCACGRALHYRNPNNQGLVQALIDRLGTHVTVTIGTRSWRVPRHYVALHGLKAVDLPRLGFPQVSPTPHAG